MSAEPNACPTWTAGFDTAIDDRTFVYIGIGLSHLAGVIAVGAKVSAAVDVTLAGGRSGDAGVPVLSLETHTRSAMLLQVPCFADVLEARADEVRHFLDQHDPRSEAIVVSALAVPTAATGERRCWATDTALARRLETKAAAGAGLDGVIPWIPSEAAPDHLDDDWWAATLERLGGDRLVAQSVGLHAGGVRTWICDSVQDVIRAADAGGAIRVSRYVDGTAANVMACVVGDAVLVLPPSRQLQARNGCRPLYAGNSFDGLSATARSTMVDDARTAGRALAAQGYVGTFGLDCIVDAVDACWYHDLNARVNGVVHAFGVHLPAFSALVLAPGWLDASNVDLAERELSALADRRPIARWYLSELFDAPSSVRVPKEGLYRLDARVPRAQYLGADKNFDAVAGDVAYVRPKCHPDWKTVADEQLLVAEAWCTAELASALERASGDGAMGSLLESLQRASGC